MSDRRPHVVIAGVSTRAWAASACRAGYRVTAVDAFGDADLRVVAEVLPLRRDGGAPYTAQDAARAARVVDAPLAAYTSNLENHPEAVALLARGRRLLGNSPAVLARVRNPLLLRRALTSRGFAVPMARASAPRRGTDGGRWLLKPRRSGGGHGTSVWRGRPVPRRAYLQERITGVAGSVVFAADGRRARRAGSLTPTGRRAGLRRRRLPLLRESAGLVRRAAVRASGGAARSRHGAGGGHDRGIRPSGRERDRFHRAARRALSDRGEPPLLGLDGAGGARHGSRLFAIHVEACGGRLSDQPSPAGQTHGKAIVYARQDLVVDDPTSWTDAPLADLPHPG